MIFSADVGNVMARESYPVVLFVSLFFRWNRGRCRFLASTMKWNKKWKIQWKMFFCREICAFIFIKFKSCCELFWTYWVLNLIYISWSITMCWKCNWRFHIFPQRAYDKTQVCDVINRRKTEKNSIHKQSLESNIESKTNVHISIRCFSHLLKVQRTHNFLSLFPGILPLVVGLFFAFQSFGRSGDWSQASHDDPICLSRKRIKLF